MFKLPLGQASPRWMGRMMDPSRAGVSTMDHLHDLLFDTEYYDAADNSTEHRKAVAESPGSTGSVRRGH